ncbi:hypothetical protein [Ferrimonas pelagia]|uniref:Uncharacterized protein n=1 Tax=Ferrimonas pelagia TaxID=1177826 RepID=A0ABP9FEQ7_9GAMM
MMARQGQRWFLAMAGLSWLLLAAMPVINAHADKLGVLSQLCPLHAYSDPRPASERPSFLPDEPPPTQASAAAAEPVTAKCPLASQSVVAAGSTLQTSLQRPPLRGRAHVRAGFATHLPGRFARAPPLSALTPYV